MWRCLYIKRHTHGVRETETLTYLCILCVGVLFSVTDGRFSYTILPLPLLLLMVGLVRQFSSNGLLSIFCHIQLCPLHADFSLTIYFFPFPLGVMKLEATKFRPRQVVKHVLQTAAASLQKILTLEGHVADDVPVEVRI